MNVRYIRASNPPFRSLDAPLVMAVFWRETTLRTDKAKNYCGANNDPTIYLRNAFNAKKCGPLESTVLHEVSHSAPLKYSEMGAFLLENKAFGTSIPTPERLQSDYPNLSPEQIQYYRNQ